MAARKKGNRDKTSSTGPTNSADRMFGQDNLAGGMYQVTRANGKATKATKPKKKK